MASFLEFVWLEEQRFPLARARGKRILEPGLARGAAHYIRGQKALGTFQELKFYGFALIERPVAIFLNGGKMHEDVFAGGALDEAVSFGSIEPLDCSLLFHKRYSFRLMFRFDLRSLQKHQPERARRDERRELGMISGTLVFVKRFVFPVVSQFEFYASCSPSQNER